MKSPLTFESDGPVLAKDASTKVGNDFFSSKIFLDERISDCITDLLQVKSTDKLNY